MVFSLLLVIPVFHLKGEVGFVGFSTAVAI